MNSSFHPILWELKKVERNYKNLPTWASWSEHHHCGAAANIWASQAWPARFRVPANMLVTFKSLVNTSKENLCLFVWFRQVKCAKQRSTERRWHFRPTRVVENDLINYLKWIISSSNGKGERQQVCPCASSLVTDTLPDPD